MSRQLRSNMNAADKAELDSNFRRITNAPPVNQSALIAALPLSTSSSPVDFIPDSSGFRPIVPQTAITFYDVANPSLIPRHPSSNADPKSRAQSPSGEPNPTEKRFNFLTDSISTVRSDIFKEKSRNDSRFETIERWRQGHEATTIAQQQNLVKSFERQQAEEIENSKLQRDLDAQEHARQHDLQTDLEAQRQARQTDLDAQRQARQTELYDRRLAQLSNFFREELQVLRVDINEIKDVIKDVVDYRISHENVHNANAATLKLIDIDSMREDITSNTNAILEHRKSLAHLQQETQDVHTFMTARLQPQDGSDTSYFSANDDTPFKSLQPVKSVTSIPILQSDLPDPPRQIPSVSIHPSALESHFDASINYPNHSTQQLRHMRAIAKVFDEDSNLSDFRSFYLQSQPHLQKSRLDYLPFFDTNSDIGTHSIFNTSRQSQPQPPIGTTDPVSLYSRLSILEKLLLPLPPTESVIYHDYDYEPFYMFFDRFDTLNKNKNAKEDNELLQYLKLSNATNPKNFKADLNLTLHKQHSAISHLQQENQDVNTLVSASLQARHSPDTSFFSISDHTHSTLSNLLALVQLNDGEIHFQQSLANINPIILYSQGSSISMLDKRVVAQTMPKLFIVTSTDSDLISSDPVYLTPTSEFVPDLNYAIDYRIVKVTNVVVLNSATNNQSPSINITPTYSLYVFGNNRAPAPSQLLTKVTLCGTFITAVSTTIFMDMCIGIIDHNTHQPLPEPQPPPNSNYIHSALPLTLYIVKNSSISPSIHGLSSSLDAFPGYLTGDESPHSLYGHFDSIGTTCHGVNISTLLPAIDSEPIYTFLQIFRYIFPQYYTILNNYKLFDNDTILFIGSITLQEFILFHLNY